MLKKVNNIEARKIAILVADGVNEHLLFITKHEIEAQGGTTRFVSTQTGYVKTSKKNAIPIDYSIHAITPDAFDALYIPGGRKSIDHLIKQKEVLEFICMIYTSGKNIAVDDESICLLEAASLNSKLSSSSVAYLKSSGIFVHDKAIPTAKHFIKAIAADYPIAKSEAKIKDVTEVSITV